MSFSVFGSVSIKNKYKKFADFDKNIARIMQQANAMAAVEIRNEAVKLIQDNSDGTKQIRYLPKRTVNVSAPGDPPNADTGRLMQSIKIERDGMAVLIGTNLKYGAALEFGTTQMQARPWLSVALRNVSDLLPDIYNKVMDNFIKGFR